MVRLLLSHHVLCILVIVFKLPVNRGTFHLDYTTGAHQIRISILRPPPPCSRLSFFSPRPPSITMFCHPDKHKEGSTLIEGEGGGPVFHF